MGNTSCCSSMNTDHTDLLIPTHPIDLREKPSIFVEDSKLGEIHWENQTMSTPQSTFVSMRGTVVNSYNEEDFMGPHQSLAVIPTLYPLIRKFPITLFDNCPSASYEDIVIDDGVNICRFYGERRKGKITGKSQMYRLPENDLYIGEFKDYLPHGKCQVYFGSGNYFEGQLNEGSLVEGKMFYANGEEYEGPFLDGKKHGAGCQAYPDGSVVFGKFVKDRLNGQVKIIGADGTISYMTVKA